MNLNFQDVKNNKIELKLQFRVKKAMNKKVPKKLIFHP